MTIYDDVEKILLEFPTDTGVPSGLIVVLSNIQSRFIVNINKNYSLVVIASEVIVNMMINERNL